MASAQETPQPQPQPVIEEDQLDYTPVAGSVTLARRRAARLVTEWGHPELAWATALLISELAGNALLHGCLGDRPFKVRTSLRADALRIEVNDPRGERLPSPRLAEDEECFGRGLLIVAQIADRWGTAPCPTGKTVYAELDITDKHDEPGAHDAHDRTDTAQ